MPPRQLDAVTRVAREQSGRVLALLARRFGDLDLADEAVQDALVRASESWPVHGTPDNPPAWLYTVARNIAIDRLRRADVERRRLVEAAPDLAAVWEEEPSMIDDDHYDGDEYLRLMLLCCHPALDLDSQIALTLRLVGGLTTAEIAAAFLVPEATLAQRIVRAKRKIRDAGIPLSIPAALDHRIDALATVLYLVFNEGYLARASSELVRVDLVEESVRLTRKTIELLPDNAEVEALLALELYASARMATRTDEFDDLVLLDRQDRSLWDSSQIAEANALLGRAIARLQPGVFQVQALIASHHANAREAADTDWPRIVALYAQLFAMSGSPVVAVNHAVAVAMADGARAGLALLDAIGGLDGYHLLHAVRGELLLREGDPAAVESFRRARELTTNAAERRHLERRIAQLR